jgi:hypothetical protein
MNTVPTATTWPAGKSAGSLQVVAVSPLRAAILPLIFTVGLPILMVALLAGGFWKRGPGWRRQMGRRVVGRAVDGRRRLPLDVDVAAQIAVDDAGKGVWQGRRHRWRTRDDDDMGVGGDDPVALFGGRLAHGSVDIDGCTLDVQRSAGFDVESRPGLDFGVGGGLDFHLPGLELDRSLRRRQADVLVAVMVIVLLAVSKTMLFFSLLSMISIFSLPSSSFRRTRWPLRDRIRRKAFLPSALSAGGLSLPFQRPPRT